MWRLAMRTVTRARHITENSIETVWRVPFPRWHRERGGVMVGDDESRGTHTPGMVSEHGATATICVIRHHKALWNGGVAVQNIKHLTWRMSLLF